MSACVWCPFATEEIPLLLLFFFFIKFILGLDVTSGKFSLLNTVYMYIIFMSVLSTPLRSTLMENALVMCIFIYLLKK